MDSCALLRLHTFKEKNEFTKKRPLRPTDFPWRLAEADSATLKQQLLQNRFMTVSLCPLEPDLRPEPLTLSDRALRETSTRVNTWVTQQSFLAPKLALYGSGLRDNDSPRFYCRTSSYRQVGCKMHSCQKESWVTFLMLCPYAWEIGYSSRWSKLSTYQS